jgi:hypothetical protein
MPHIYTHFQSLLQGSATVILNSFRRTPKTQTQSRWGFGARSLTQYCVLVDIQNPKPGIGAPENPNWVFYGVILSILVTA